MNTGAGRSPVKRSPSRRGPAKMRPAQMSPAPRSPEKMSPAQSTPTQRSPAHISPALSSPGQKRPARRSRAKMRVGLRSPVQRSPEQSSPTQWTPVQSSRAHRSPTKRNPGRKSPAERSPTPMRVALVSPVRRCTGQSRSVFYTDIVWTGFTATEKNGQSPNNPLSKDPFVFKAVTAPEEISQPLNISPSKNPVLFKAVTAPEEISQPLNISPSKNPILLKVFRPTEGLVQTTSSPLSKDSVLYKDLMLSSDETEPESKVNSPERRSSSSSEDIELTEETIDAMVKISGSLVKTYAAIQEDVRMSFNKFSWDFIPFGPTVYQAESGNDQAMVSMVMNVPEPKARKKMDQLLQKVNSLMFLCTDTAGAARCSAKPNWDKVVTNTVECLSRRTYLQFVNSQDLMGRTPLHHLAMNGEFTATLMMLENGADMRIKDILGRNTVHYSAVHNSPEVFRLLIEWDRMNPGAKTDVSEQDLIQVTDLHNRTALHLAASRGLEYMVRVILSYGANPNCTDIFMRTPLHYASMSIDPGTYNALILHKADEDALDTLGKRPADFRLSEL